LIFVDLDPLDDVFDAEADGHEAVVAEAVDADHAVFRVHFVGDFVEPVDAFAEAFSDAVDGRYVIDLGPRGWMRFERQTLPWLLTP
jgi:hypothetical protein